MQAALPPVANAPIPAAALAAGPLLAPSDPGWFVIRCVYERPHCGPLAPPLVSEPTDVFQLGGFFDPDAPARPIRIGLPIDTSPAGLRKFDKNTAFMVSDMLCGQIQRVKGLTLGDLVLSVLPWPFHKDLSVPAGGPVRPMRGGSLGMMLLALDSDHHDLRADAADDHRQPARHHLPLAAVFHDLLSRAGLSRAKEIA